MTPRRFFDYNLLDEKGIEDLKILWIGHWIYERCKDIVTAHWLFSDYAGFFSNVTKLHYRYLEKVSVEWLDVTQSIMVMFHYKTKRPARVYFIHTQETPTTSDYYQAKVVYDFTKIKIK